MPRAPLENRLPFNSPDLGVKQANSGGVSIRSAVKTLPPPYDNPVSCKEVDPRSKRNDIKLSFSLRKENKENLVEKPPAGLSESSTPPRKQVLFADSPPVDIEHDKGNDLLTQLMSKIANRTGTPFRPQPRICLYSPFVPRGLDEQATTKTFQNKDNEEPSATIPLLMLTAALRDDANLETDSVKVVVPDDVIDEDYDDDWYSLDGNKVDTLSDFSFHTASLVPREIGFSSIQDASTAVGESISPSHIDENNIKAQTDVNDQQGELPVARKRCGALGPFWMICLAAFLFATPFLVFPNMESSTVVSTIGSLKSMQPMAQGEPVTQSTPSSEDFPLKKGHASPHTVRLQIGTKVSFLGAPPAGLPETAHSGARHTWSHDGLGDGSSSPSRRSDYSCAFQSFGYHAKDWRTYME